MTGVFQFVNAREISVQQLLSGAYSSKTTKFWGFAGRDWNFFIRECTREQCQTTSTWKFLWVLPWSGDLWASAAGPKVSLTTSSARTLWVKKMVNGVTEKCKFGTNLGRRPTFEYIRQQHSNCRNVSCERVKSLKFLSSIYFWQDGFVICHMKTNLVGLNQASAYTSLARMKSKDMPSKSVDCRLLMMSPTIRLPIYYNIYI